jgi:hypothetical protein
MMLWNTTVSTSVVFSTCHDAKGGMMIAALAAATAVAIRAGIRPANLLVMIMAEIATSDSINLSILHPFICVLPVLREQPIH